jgi:hypothetical protein
MIIHSHIPKRKKRKPTAKQRALQASWQDILKKYEPKGKVIAAKSKPSGYTQPYRRETPHYPSLNSHEGCCTKTDGVKYTGTAMMGIATLHKSNAVPVFSQEDAVEISRMRRG